MTAIEKNNAALSFICFSFFSKKMEMLGIEPRSKSDAPMSGIASHRSSNSFTPVESIHPPIRPAGFEPATNRLKAGCSTS
jgi:hypothetical protein